MRTINVLELTTTLEVGGTEKMIYYLARGLDKKKFNVTVACLTCGGAIADELRRAGIDVHPLCMKSKFDVGIIYSLYSLIKEKKVDLLHTYLFHANLLGRIVGKLAGVPVIISSERTMGYEGKHRKVMNRITSPLATAFTANSHAVKNFMVEEIRLPEEKINVIYNGVDLEMFELKVEKEKMRKSLGVEREDMVCVTVARLDVLKGVSYLIKAARKVVEEKPNTRFLIVGDGPLKKELKKLSNRLGLDEHVFFLGLRHDIPEILKSSDIFILPSVWEGLPNAVLEAMAAGLPIVATKTAGVPELVSEGETGFLAEPKNPDALAETIIRSLSHKEKLEEMGRIGRKRVEEFFSLEKMIKENELFYEGLIKEKGVL